MKFVGFCNYRFLCFKYYCEFFNILILNWGGKILYWFSCLIELFFGDRLIN